MFQQQNIYVWLSPTPRSCNFFTIHFQTLTTNNAVLLFSSSSKWIWIFPPSGPASYHWDDKHCKKQQRPKAQKVLQLVWLNLSKKISQNPSRNLWWLPIEVLNSFLLFLKMEIRFKKLPSVRQSSYHSCLSETQFVVLVLEML